MNLIESVNVTENAIEVRASSRFSERFLRDDFFAEYSIPISQVPLSVLIVPFLTNVAPIAWLSGETWHVPEITRSFAESLEDLRREFSTQYPDLDWTGRIAAERETDHVAGDTRTVALFSGGVDSLFTASGLEEHLTLFTVWGSDMDLENPHGWESMWRHTRELAAAHGHEPVSVKSNFRTFLDIPRLEQWAVGDWWANIQHGIGLAGLAAPVVSRGRVYIAATHTSAFQQNWGSSPSIDDLLAWADTNVEHHGYGLTRQEKIEQIVRIFPTGQPLRVCYSHSFGKGENCGQCEKCMRTTAGLLVAGAAPEDYGLPPRHVAAPRIQRRFQTLRVPFSKNERFMWNDIRGRVTGSSEGGFEQWISEFDFDAYERKWRRLAVFRKSLIKGLRRWPTLERTLKRARSGLRR